jgi:hypothetical protein
MTWVTARCIHGSWQVHVGRAAAERVFVAPADVPVPVIGAFLGDLRRGVPDILWFLELSKAQLQSHGPLLAAADRFVDAVLADPRAVHGWETGQGARAARAVRLRLIEKGAAVARDRGDEVRAAVVFCSAALVAVLAWVWSLVVHHPLRTKPPAEAEVVRAIYGERSNRTRALLPPAIEVGKDVPYLILGRPRSSLRRVAAELGLDGPGGPVLFRAASWTSGLASIGAIPRLFRDGLASIGHARVIPSHAEQVAIGYRVLMGATYANWWGSAGMRPTSVIYAHTGLADTTALELAQQAAGARTMHLVHGVSAGWNFTGCSSLGVFQCGFDATWHRSLPAYGATTSPRAEAPEARPGGLGWVVCSNYLHPMNPRLVEDGLAQEMRLLDLVAAAARLVAHAPERVVWKPHPTFKALDAAIREAAVAHAATLGFEAWNDRDGMSAMAGFRMVITTPSTIALDAMRLGKVPIVAAGDDFATETVIGAFPASGPRAGDLARLVDDLEAPGAYQAWHRRTWELVQPGVPVTNRELEQLLQTRVPSSGGHRPAPEAAVRRVGGWKLRA